MTALVILVALLSAPVAAQPSATTSDAWATATGVGTAAVYLVISNPTMYDIYVTSATSDAAGKVELYSGAKLVESMTVPSYGSLELKAGGMFLRLADVKRAFKAGEQITVTLLTDGGILIVAAAAVK